MVDASEQSSSLFAVFFLSIYTLVLIPYTIYKLCTAASTTSEVVKPWQKVCFQGYPALLVTEGRIVRIGRHAACVQAQKSSRTSKFVRRLLQPSNLLLLLLWAIFVFLVYYVQVGSPLPRTPGAMCAVKPSIVRMRLLFGPLLALLCGTHTAAHDPTPRSPAEVAGGEH